MNKTRWIETKKECEIDEKGELVIKKVTLELEKHKGLERKDIIDISLRLVSLLAIFIPILLFFQQQKAERDKQKALFQLDVYSNVTTKLHSLVNVPISSKEFEITKNELFYDIYPKLKLLNDKVVTDTFAKLKDIINFTYGLSSVSNAADSLNKCFVVLIDEDARQLTAPSTTNVSGKELEQFRWFEKLSNGESKIRNWNYETDQVRSFCRKYQQRAAGYIRSLQQSADKLIYPQLPKSDESKEEEYRRQEEDNQNYNDFISAKSLFDDFNNKYDSTFKSYLQERTLILDSLMTTSNSFFYNR